jgi:hypothetical protein
MNGNKIGYTREVTHKSNALKFWMNVVSLSLVILEHLGRLFLSYFLELPNK